MKSTFDFICDCKTETQIDYNPPGTLDRKAELITCRACLSIYTVVFHKEISGEIRYTLSLSRPSRRLAEILARDEMKKRTNQPQKKAPLFVVPSLARKA